MARQTPSSLRTRCLAGAAALSLQIALGLLLSTGPTRATERGASPAALTVVFLNDPSPQSLATSLPKHARQKQPPETLSATGSQASTQDEAGAATPILTANQTAALAAFEPLTTKGEPNAPCKIAQSLAADLNQIPAVAQTLADLPASERSVANATMLWDSHWSDDSNAKAFLRAFVSKELAASRPECLAATNRGPTLFLVPAGNRTVTVVIGSGQWQWSDLLADDAPLATSQNEQALASK